jgi:hypothetical protein
MTPRRIDDGSWMTGSPQRPVDDGQGNMKAQKIAGGRAIGWPRPGPAPTNPVFHLLQTLARIAR